MKPKVFIGSSNPARLKARHLQKLLDDHTETTVWDQDVFVPSSYLLEALANQISQSDFAIFFFNPDDDLITKGELKKSVRDNVIFELGLAMGMLGRGRSIVVMPRVSTDLSIPSDLQGLTFLTYNADRSDGNVSAALGPASISIIEHIRRQGMRHTNVFDGDNFGEPTVIKRELYEESLNNLKTNISLNTHSNFSLAIFDIDNFYGINIVYGSETANEIIDRITKIIGGRSLQVHRIGGDKFATLTSLRELDDLNHLIRSYDWESLHIGLYITCSVGYSRINCEEKAEMIIIRALQGLKIAKKTGKNTISEGPKFIEKKLDIWNMDCS